MLQLFRRSHHPRNRRPAAVGELHNIPRELITDFYWDLMNFWYASLPGRIYSLDYDNLTRNQEADTRSLINYLGLKWDECCLSPHKNRRSVANASSVQVRRKIYEGSSEHWRNYQPFLDGALDNLGSRADALPDL